MSCRIGLLASEWQISFNGILLIGTAKSVYHVGRELPPIRTADIVEDSAPVFGQKTERNTLFATHSALSSTILKIPSPLWSLYWVHGVPFVYWRAGLVVAAKAAAELLLWQPLEAQKSRVFQTKTAPPHIQIACSWQEMAYSSDDDDFDETLPDMQLLLEQETAKSKKERMILPPSLFDPVIPPKPKPKPKPKSVSQLAKTNASTKPKTMGKKKAIVAEDSAPRARREVKVGGDIVGKQVRKPVAERMKVAVGRTASPVSSGVSICGFFLRLETHAPGG